MSDKIMKESLAEIERYATEMVNEGYLTREVVDEKRKEANRDADEWVTLYKDKILKSSVEDLHDAVFGLHFAKFVCNTRIKAAQIKLESPDWQTLTSFKNYFDDRITKILDL